MKAPDISCALFNLRRTARTITQLYDEILRPTGLRSTQYSLLRVLYGVGPVAVSELGAAIGMDRTTLTRNVRLLEQMGYLRIEPGEDKRTRVLQLTTRGRTAVDKAMPYWKKAQSIVVEGLGDSRWDELRSELNVVTELGREELNARNAS